jgi:hypothetical protein
MIYKFTDDFEIENETYYAILSKEDGEYVSCGIVLGECIPEYKERFAEYYLTTMRQPESIEDLVKDL